MNGIVLITDRLDGASSTMSSKVSFTVRRPSPLSRASSGIDSDTGRPQRRLPSETPIGSPLARNEDSEQASVDSSDEDDEVQDELVTGFDKFGVQRAKAHKKKADGPLVIPALKNRDWRDLARKRRSGTQYVPSSGASGIGKDGSVGGLGTRDSINSGPQLVGLQVRKKVTESNGDSSLEVEEIIEDVEMVAPQDEETEDQKALRAILAESRGETQYDGPIIDIIPTPVSEEDALKQDVDELPESSTLDDYARVPVSQFGAALLRGMGWKEGTAASRKPGKGLVEPYLPTARPSLLGIGAKEQEVYDDGSKKTKNRRPEKRYVPVVRQERSGTSTPDGDYSSRDRDRRDRSRSPRRSAAPSRRGSHSPDRYGRNGDSRRPEDRERASGDRERRRDEKDNDGNRDRERRRDDGRDKDRDRRKDDDRQSRQRDSDKYRSRDDRERYDRRRD